MLGSSAGRWLGRIVSLGTLAVLGLAFVAGPPKPARAQDECRVPDGECTLTKPNYLFLVEWSSAMALGLDGQPVADPSESRWARAVDVISQAAVAQNGFFTDDAHWAVMRFGSPGCGLDATGTTTLDLPWVDESDPDRAYLGCNAEGVVQTLAALPAPGAGPGGCEAWTAAALQDARSLVAQDRALHPLPQARERWYKTFVVTQGSWSGPGGNGENRDPLDDPVEVAASLLNDDDHATFALAMTSEDAGKADADALATAGGTNRSMDGANADGLEEALQVISDDLRQPLVPSCVQPYPRMMLILDASSSMLQGDRAGHDTPWDRAIEALTGDQSIFDAQTAGEHRSEDWLLSGLLVYAGEDPQDDRVLLPYAPCAKDNIAWAIDPLTSCSSASGCADPWSQDPPLTYQPLTSPPSDHAGAPPFNVVTHSHLPACNATPTGDAETCSGPSCCRGSPSFVHRGLELAFANARWIQQEGDPFPLWNSDHSPYANILVTDGKYVGYSTDDQVRSVLEAMYQAGITTYVLSVGDDVDSAALENMAAWGSDSTQDPYDGNSPADRLALGDLLAGDISVDPCCEYLSCVEQPEPEYDSETWGRDGPPDPSTSTGTGGTSSSTGGDDLPTGTVGSTTTGDGETQGGSTSGGPSETAGPTGADTSPEPPGQTTGSTGTGGAGGGARVIGSGCACQHATGSSHPWVALFCIGFFRRRRQPNARSTRMPG